MLDGIPQALPALALADKVLGKAEKLGLIDVSDTPTIPMDDETALGKLLLAIVSSARAAGLEPERALREATRELKFARLSSTQITMLVLLGLIDPALSSRAPN